MKPHILVWLAPAALFFDAVAPLPYAFYMLLRVVVCAACGYLAWADYQSRGASGWVVALVVASVVFNPFVPIHLFKEAWMLLNLAVAALLVFHMMSMRRRDV